MTRLLLTPLIFLILSFPALAKKVYQTPESFLADSIGDKGVQLKVVWLSPEDKESISKILQRKFSRLRIKYWRKGIETAWVLEEIGKEKPITVGVHISEGKISQLKVLTYRESRGDEVKHNFFTRQFNQARLIENYTLSQNIDGITGATLSVRALKKIATLSLWLHQKELNKDN